MKKHIVVLLLLLSVQIMQKLHAQDLIRVGIGGDFKKSNFIQTLTFDLNRTEQLDEKKGRFFVFSDNGYYLLPTVDVNIGEKTTSSENNVLLQLTAGKIFYGEKRRNDAEKILLVWNKAIEINPSYNADKNFIEKLGYAQVKFILNPIWSKFYPSNKFKNESSLAFGVFGNNGFRHSATYAKNSAYSTGGAIASFKERFRNDGQTEDNVVLALSGNYYRIFSELDELTDDKYAGALKASVDKLLAKKFYMGLVYKYGNDNPTYTCISTLELALKIQY